MSEQLPNSGLSVKAKFELDISPDALKALFSPLCECHPSDRNQQLKDLVPPVVKALILSFASTPPSDAVKEDSKTGEAATPNGAATTNSAATPNGAPTTNVAPTTDGTDTTGRNPNTGRVPTVSEIRQAILGLLGIG